MTDPHATGRMPMFCCEPGNDLYRAYLDGGGVAGRTAVVTRAVKEAVPGSAVLLLADGYPRHRTEVSAADLSLAARKDLRLYVEFPAALPGVQLGEPRVATWERLAVMDDSFAPSLTATALLGAHAFVYLPAQAERSLLAIARVAGYDRAIFGLPDGACTALFELPGDAKVFVATTRLSSFRAGRYAPSHAWTELWQGILGLIDAAPVRLRWTPVVAPSHLPGAEIDRDAERTAIARARRWHLGSELFLTREGELATRALLKAGMESGPPHGPPAGSGDGSFGVLEGFESVIQPDGSQRRRISLRADCVAETAMVMSMSATEPAEAGTEIADNLLGYLFGASGMCGGDRGDPRHPAYGLIAWGVGTPAWEVANYGDDNARVLLACLLTSARRGTTQWMEPVLRGVLANFRTTGRSGFRGDRVDMPQLTKRGWRDIFDGEVTNLAPFFESYLWACYLWASQVTGYAPFAERAVSGITRTMTARPDHWRRNDSADRARLLLPLAWLVRIRDTPQHRRWLTDVAADLVEGQHASGAVPECERGGAGLFHVPHSNDEYGLSESPIIQETGDPASDQLYTSGFALLGLHEAAAATGDLQLREYANKLAGYLVRIQTRSEEPSLDGTWFRAFDFERWDYWASSGDLGWGAWCVELGWGQAWIIAALALRRDGSSLWDEACGVTPDRHLAARLLSEMLGADGSA